jgi:cyanophycinase
MSGYILLEGGAEFGGHMAVPDRRALMLAGGLDALVSIVPAAAAPDNNHQKAGQNGVRWFRSLGATQVTSLPLIDRAAAEDPVIVDILRRSALIYLLGGFPGHIGRTLADSAAWQAILAAHRTGAVIAGSSAGAMVLCEHYYDPHSQSIVRGLNLLPAMCVLPHHDTFGKSWAAGLRKLLRDSILVGIDEETGLLNDAPHGRWRPYGKGCVTVYRNHQCEEICIGDTVALPG